MEGNNLSKEIADYRDKFLDADRELVERVRKDKTYGDFIEKISLFDATKLFDYARSIVEQVQSGVIKEEAFEKTEIQIICLLSAIKDMCIGEREKGERTNARKVDGDWER